MRGKVYWEETMFGETITEKQKPIEHKKQNLFRIWYDFQNLHSCRNQALGKSQRCSSEGLDCNKKCM